MGYFFQNGFGHQNSMTLSYTCINCGNNITSNEIEIPSPNMSSSKESDAINFEDVIVCDKCDMEYNWNFTVSPMNVSGSNEDISEDEEVSVEYS
ncbi:hypothetical protein SAMN05661096_02919 [Marivirga sericea]|uniref:Uncharacterized protein n=1 Tax=Marivirga sericea TaxID=1028 RepID=A0A1X7KNN0_9BACT|nr:hypothetical protein [Marivirga sericea]SMG42701.1 hypothetical protein SAMN05661096_02919 [Marivirga sericea]